MRKFPPVAAASLLPGACNPMAEMGEADEQIEQFHAQYSAQEFESE